MNTLLISSSFCGGLGYLEHAREVIVEFLDDCPAGRIVFVPYAGSDMDWYAETAKAFFADIDQSLVDEFISLHQTNNPREVIEAEKVKAIFVAGGNTFRLLKALQDNDLLEPIRRKVQSGTGYMGASAGSNVACPTIMTTNDMPIVEPQGFGALGLVGFQINPHFVPGALLKDHHGETREERIAQYLEENDRTVIGIPETAWIRVKDKSITLGGADAMVFERDTEPWTWTVATQL